MGRFRPSVQWAPVTSALVFTPISWGTPVAEALIEARDVCVTFGSGARTVHAVKGASLEIAAGEAVGIVGESGSGKSTLARVLAGLQKPDSGEVFFEGQSIYERGKAYRGDKRHLVQMVFQDPYGSLNPRMTALSTVAEAVRVHGDRSEGDPKDVGLKLLARMGIGERDGGKKPRQLSGGQRQRVSVARALSAKPAVLLADEPTSAIDQSAQAQLLNLFRGLLDDGLSIALVSHDLGVIHYLTSRVYVMKDGVFVESGPTQQIFDHPQEAYA